MTTYSTGNPLGSSDPRDLYDNAENLDNFVNGAQPAYDDRLGESRKSWAGIESEFQGDQVRREDQFQQFLLESGYVGTGPNGAYEDYDTDGPLTITALNQIFTKDGEFYRAKADLSMPYTTTGTWVGDDENRFVSVGDANLRQELADQSGAGFGTDLIGHDGGTARAAINQRTIYVGSVVELEALSLDEGAAVYLTQEGRAGEFVVKAGTPPSDPQKGIYIVLANGNYAERVGWDSGEIHAGWFGLVSDLSGNDGFGTGTVSGADQTSILNSVFSFAENRTVNLGDYRAIFTSDINLPENTKITGDGFYLYGDGAVLSASGARTEVAYVSATAPKGSLEVTVSDASALSAGDEIIIQNTNSGSFYSNPTDSRDYTDGEFCVIESISGNTLTLSSHTTVAHGGSTTIKVFRVDPAFVNMSGGTIETSGSSALSLTLCKDIDIDMNILGGTVSAFYINQCLGGSVSGGTIRHNTGAATGNNYGISIANSQDIEISNVDAKALRHGIAFGGAPGDGAVPCRNVIVRDSRIGNWMDTLHAADIHGWAANCYYVDCAVDGAIGLGGLDCGAPGCSAIGKSTSSPAKAILLTELVGGTVDLRNMRVRFSGDAPALNAFGIASSSQFGAGGGVRDYIINLDGLEVECKPSMTSVIQHLHNLPGDVNWSISARNMIVTGNYSGIINVVNLNISNTLSHSSVPIAADQVSYDGLIFKNGKVTVSRAKPSLSGDFSATRFNVPEFSISNALGWIRYLSDGSTNYIGSQEASIGTTNPYGSLYVSPQRAFSVPGDWEETVSAVLSSSVGFCTSIGVTSSTVTYYVAHESNGTGTKNIHFNISGRWIAA